MRIALFCLWLLLPLGGLAWHFGPGQSSLARDETNDLVRRAESAQSRDDWQMAVVLYGQAIDCLPEEDAERTRLGLEQARAIVQSGQLVEGQERLEELLDATQHGSSLAATVRHELGTVHYFTAWLMRLEGATSDEWEPEADLARQHFRFLAEGAEPATDDSETFRRNLEATIRLQQMDLSELLALPLPKKCPNNCRNLSQRKRKQCQSRGQGKKKEQRDKKGKKKGPQDVRKQLKQINSAGLSQRSGSGS